MRVLGDFPLSLVCTTASLIHRIHSQPCLLHIIIYNASLEENIYKIVLSENHKLAGPQSFANRHVCKLSRRSRVSSAEALFWFGLLFHLFTSPLPIPHWYIVFTECMYMKGLGGALCDGYEYVY